MVDSGEMVGELVGGNVAVLWAMAEVFSGRAAVEERSPESGRSGRGARSTLNLLGSGVERLGRRRFWPRCGVVVGAGQVSAPGRRGWRLLLPYRRAHPGALSIG
jgi:hypothetical protein